MCVTAYLAVLKAVLHAFSPLVLIRVEPFAFRIYVLN